MSFPQKNLCFLINADVYTLNSFFWSTVHWSSSDGRLRSGTLKTTPGASSAGMGLTGEAGVIALDDGLEGNASGRGEEADISAVFVLGGWGSYSWIKNKKKQNIHQYVFPFHSFIWLLWILNCTNRILIMHYSSSLLHVKCFVLE